MPRSTIESPIEIRIRVADEVWIAMALLHREQPEREDFAVQEIIKRASREGLTPTLRPGVAVHAYLHCVANKAPNPARYRMLLATGEKMRRLYRPSDTAHPSRDGKITPRPDQIPTQYHELLEWYEREYSSGRRGLHDPGSSDPGPNGPKNPMWSLWGLGREIWEDEDPDEYVRRLREGWD